jgi:hypothetical protein
MSQAHRGFSLLVAACALAAVTSGGAFASTADTVHPSAADQALAKAAVLHLSDFTPGSGWVAATAPSNGRSAGAGSSCAAASKTTGLTETGHAVSAFKAPGFYVQSWATILQTPAMVQLDWRRSTPFILGCLRGAIAHSLNTSTSMTSIVELPFPKVAPLLHAYRATVSVTVQGTTIPMVADILIYARGRTELELLQVSPQAFASEAKAAEQRIASLLSLRATA